jgi:hypothetical protein
LAAGPFGKDLLLPLYWTLLSCSFSTADPSLVHIWCKCRRFGLKWVSAFSVQMNLNVGSSFFFGFISEYCILFQLLYRYIFSYTVFYNTILNALLFYHVSHTVNRWKIPRLFYHVNAN